MSPLLYRVTCRIDGSRDPAAIAELVSEDLGRSLTADQVRHLITVEAAAPRHRRRRGRPGRPAEGQPAARAQGAGHAAVRACGERRRGAAAAAVPRARRRGRSGQRRGRGLVAVRRPRAGRRASAGPARPGGPADRARPVTVVSAVFHECGHAVGCRYGGARPGVIGVGIYLVWPSFFTNVTDSYRLVPGRAAAHRPRRPVLQRGLHAGPGRHLRGHLGRGPAPGHRHHAPGDAGAADAVRPLRRLLHPQSTWSACRTCSPASPPSCGARVSRGRRDPRVTGLRRRARIVVTGWVLCVIPLLTFSIGYLVLYLPADQPGAVALRQPAGPSHDRRRGTATATRWPQSTRSASRWWPCRSPDRSTS